MCGERARGDVGGEVDGGWDGSGRPVVSRPTLRAPASRALSRSPPLTAGIGPDSVGFSLDVWIFWSCCASVNLVIVTDA